MTSPTPSASVAVGDTQSYVTLSAAFTPVLQAAQAGGGAVDDYYQYRNQKSQSLSQLFDDIAVHPFAAGMEGDGTPIMVAQSGDAAARIRLDVLSSQEADDGSGQTVTTCSGTVAMLSGTDMHSKTVTIMTVTSLGVGALISVCQQIGLQVMTNLFTSCIAAGRNMLAAGGDAAEMGMEQGVEMAVADGAEEAVAAQAVGVEMAVEVAAVGTSAATFAGPIAAGLGLVATLLAVAVQKTMVHWLDVYNMTGEDITMSQPWDHDASFGLKPQPAVIPKAVTDALGQQDVSYTSYMSQNSNGFAGYQYMVQAASSAGGLGNLLATFNIPFSSDNSVCLESLPSASVDYDVQWESQLRVEQTSLSFTCGKYQATLVSNALSGEDGKFMSVLYLVDPALFPNFVAGPVSA